MTWRKHPRPGSARFHRSTDRTRRSPATGGCPMPRETRVRLRARRQHIMPAAGGALHRRSCSAPQVVRRTASAPTPCCRRLTPSPRVGTRQRWFRDCQQKIRNTPGLQSLRVPRHVLPFFIPKRCELLPEIWQNFREHGTAGWGSGKSEKVSGCSKLPPETSRAHLVPLKCPGENFPITIRNSLRS